MSVFELHQAVLQDYRDFVHSFLLMADDRAREFVEQSLLEEKNLWPEPLLQLSPAYRRAASLQDLASRGLLHPRTVEIFQPPGSRPLRLYQHQVEAIEKAQRGESFVVTSGTGSGKSYCFFIPIVDAVVRLGTPPPGERRGPVAFIIYPMNALVNSQLAALEDLKQRYEQGTGEAFPLTFARFTGETSIDEKDEIRKNPPHVLLTNYVMAELMLVRPTDRPLIASPPYPDTPLFLVFDELHTYRGRQGADVAMLVRRLKARLDRDRVVHIGTSATMVAHREATAEERRRAVADFASRFFGHGFTPEDVIEETLEPVTEGGPPEATELRQAFSTPLPEEPETFRRHPLVRWVEYALGVEPEADGRLRRRVPRTLSDAAKELSSLVDEPCEHCRERLEEVLTRAADINRRVGEPVFAFKLHQFISQGRSLYATLESPDGRAFTLEGELHGPQGKRFFPLRFCRVCGQDYYYVLHSDDRFLPYPLAGGELLEGSQAGYLMATGPGLDWSEDLLPEDWFTQHGRLSPTWKDRVPVPIWVRPDGTYSPEPIPDGLKMWWQQDRFWLCLRCGEYYTGRESEFTKLASLSSEGRSSATTVLAVSLLRHAARMNAARGKLLSFTDNRQDASLQAGHFNDFVHAAVLRSALYAALTEQKQLTYDRVAAEVVRHSGLRLQDIAKNPQVMEGSRAAEDIWRVFTALTEYRLYEDLRRGWRVVQPNLEDVGLLRIRYRGLEECCADEALWQDVPELTALTPEDRLRVLHTVLDHFRKRLAIDANVLREVRQQQLRNQAEQHLNEFWGLDPTAERLRPGTCFVRPGASDRFVPGFRLTARSALGRWLKGELDLAPDRFDAFVDGLLEALTRQDLLRPLDPVDDHRRYQLNAASLEWHLGDGSPPVPDPIYTRRDVASEPVSAQTNAFFQRFYQEAAGELVELEAREHTAQVVAAGEREVREIRFRCDAEDMERLELTRCLPYLVCSPTMELGIDIADLDMVHMRNVPPTPANYAQRSGRAGRQGQPGLIVTYCGAFSSHDQYFFRHREDMVAGSVRAPRLDLTNEALVRAHVQAEWLAQVGLPLRDSISEVIETAVDGLPLKEEASAQIQLSETSKAQLRRRLEAVLAFDWEDLVHRSGWFSDRWLDHVLAEAPETFDRAFDRWRELYRIADTQFTEAIEALRNATTVREQEEAKQRLYEATRQRNLLLQIDVAREESDFYPYRYLASEGFLPGYNFPALPIRAWVPRGDGEFIPRPRFLAIREFAPQNIVYHEGAKWQVVSFQFPPGGLEERMAQRRICRRCGAIDAPHLDRCPVCDVLFDGSNSEIVNLLEMPNVRLARRERITCNEEERLRRGYNIEITYRFAPATDEGPRVVEADVLRGDTALMSLRYAPAATIVLVNHGWRAKREDGFLVDLSSGELVSEADHEQEPKNAPPDQSQVKRLRLFVQDTQNMLLVHLPNGGLHADASAEVTLLYALKRGIEQAFQLEENELVVARVGEGEFRSLMFIEAAEGGVGALRRLVEEPDAVARVAQEALGICHFDIAGTDQKPECYQACYECLLSYSNQFESHLLNRHRVLEFLQALAQAQTRSRYQGRSRSEHFEWLRSLTDSRSELERRFLDVLERGGYRLPDDAQRPIREADCIADFFYEPNVAVFCDGSVHDEPAQRERDRKVRQQLVTLGYRVVVIRYDEDIEEQIRRYPEVFGGGDLSKRLA